jgi:molybdate/tungstate transport system substrate-binding protein
MGVSTQCLGRTYNRAMNRHFNLHARPRFSATKAALAGTACVALAAAGFGTSEATASTASTAKVKPAVVKHNGDVDVLSAGSLDTLMTKKVGPAFHAATGYTLVDTSGGSSTLAADIKNKIDVADVFVSASPAVDNTIRGPKNGGFVSWYADFATSPEVLGYYPKSTFAKDLRTMPWYKVITLPGFRLGRTDPTQDPGGVLAVKALDETASAQHLPALKKLATETSDEYPEDTEEADIENGQLDASFMYEADANSQDSPFVKLTGTDLAGDYTITTIKHAPHLAAAEAFVEFLLGPTGRAEMKGYHFGIVSPPKVIGNNIPSGLKSLF